MEFEENAPITDDQRVLAESRRLSIQPLDPAVKPEEYSDEHSAAEHLRAEAIANAPNDIEQDSAVVVPAAGLVSPTASKKAPPLPFVRAGVIGAIAFIAIVVAAIVFYALG